ncbi:MAG: hypothetical protein ACREB6_13585 [Rhodospirillales bacterium]
MTVNAIPLWTALLPAVGVHACYLIGAALGHLSWCVPYFADCVSISATGRHPPESILFRATVIPTAVLMLIYWKLSYEWLKALGRPAAWRGRTMLGLGLVAGLGLFAYGSILGEVGDLYKLQRRVGMTLFYVFTFLAQALLTLEAWAAAARGGAPISGATLRALAAVSGAVAVLGTISFLSWTFYGAYRRYEDAFEWTVTLLIMLHPVAAWVAWRETGFKARLEVPDHRP